MSQVDKIIAYEQGDLGEAETVELFQELIDTGMAWKLQGHYGRTAQALIDSGHCSLPDEHLNCSNWPNCDSEGCGSGELIGFKD